MSVDESTIVLVWPDPGVSAGHVEKLIDHQRALRAKAMVWTKTPHGWEGRFCDD